MIGKLTDSWPSLTDFFFKNKKIAKIILKMFFEFFFSKNFLYENFFLQIFFWWKFLLSNFFGENFSFHKNISAKIFFTIFSRISFVFDFCEIMYFAKFLIHNFAYWDFCFAILVYGILVRNFWLRFFCQRRTWIPNLKMFLFWKKVKFPLIVLLDFFTHY